MKHTYSRLLESCNCTGWDFWIYGPMVSEEPSISPSATEAQALSSEVESETSDTTEIAEISPEMDAAIEEYLYLRMLKKPLL